MHQEQIRRRMRKRKKIKEREEEKERMEKREMAKVRKVEFKKTRAFVGDRIRMCRIKRIGRKKMVRECKKCVERDMKKLCPLQKDRR